MHGDEPMHRIAAMRMSVPLDAAAEFEEDAREQLRRVREDEPGTTLYGFVRRDAAGSPLLSSPRPTSAEYFHFMAYEDEKGWDAHFASEQEWWVPTFRAAIDAPLVAERFTQGNVVAMVSRDHVWNDSGVDLTAIFRLKITEARAAEFEREAARQVEIVTENEPGTILYGFLRREPAASGLLPQPVQGQTEYLHCVATGVDEARSPRSEVGHPPESWLGRVAEEFLVAPLEGEAFPAGSVVAAVSRAKRWQA
jgi:quinol monooxygenase YgiN